MTSQEIRQKYLDFFAARGHAIIPSASLLPENDPTTLFTGSGMQPLVPCLLGEAHPLGRRLVNSQKSFRAEDMDEVGDNRHTTFFEMLGNWSLGDYFKKEQLAWFFEFLTDGVGLDPQRLYISVFAGDEKNSVPRDTESVEIWKKAFAAKGIEARDAELLTEARGGELGMQDGRIFYYDAKKNWWSRSGTPDQMPAGEPGGPDSEVFFDFQTPHDPKFGKECHPNCDCGRFMEIGNSVFMEYRRVIANNANSGGNNANKNRGEWFEKLPQRNVDFGGGLERIAAASINCPDIFKIDTLGAILEEMKRRFSWDYDLASDGERKIMRIVADHLRAAVFMAGDGVFPSNKHRGYMLRKILRRAIFKAHKLASGFSNLYPLANTVISSYKSAYPELAERSKDIHSVLEEEEMKFMKTIVGGTREFEHLVKNGKITGVDAFNLYQSHGFPWELTEELSLQRGLDVNPAEFQAEFEKHQELSRTASAGTFRGGLADQSEPVVRLHTTTHLLNAALRKVLGDHVWQKGSNITPERTRFDFTHAAKLTEEQKQEVEKIVNEAIARDYEVKKEVLPLEEARKLGAIGVFGEKYSDTVSAYTVWDPETGEVFSREFCGGPHVAHTGEIKGKFHVVKEEAVAAGVRRIKGVVE
ncbi:MAG: alanine--tRNA ligase [Candidatus Liptonbacteria bacterium]|nr:alanine--tRNA ligase [Candidatus Liptonbacteria bacterium]